MASPILRLFLNYVVSKITADFGRPVFLEVLLRLCLPANCELMIEWLPKEVGSPRVAINRERDITRQPEACKTF